MRSQPIHHRAPPLRAAIYGPTRQIGRWQPTCTAWCTDRGYDLVSVIDETPDAARWSDLLHAMADGDIDIVVIASLADLPPGRSARVEIIGRRRPIRRRHGIRAVLYGPAESVTQWGRRGLMWADCAGLDVRDLVAETPDAGEWPGVVQRMAMGEIDVVAMESWGLLPPHRLPRIEVAGTSPPGLLRRRAAEWWRHQ